MGVKHDPGHKTGRQGEEGKVFLILQKGHKPFAVMLDDKRQGRHDSR